MQFLLFFYIEHAFSGLFFALLRENVYSFRQISKSYNKDSKKRLIVKKFGPISNLDVVNGEKQAIE